MKKDIISTQWTHHFRGVYISTYSPASFCIFFYDLNKSYKKSSFYSTEVMILPAILKAEIRFYLDQHKTSTLVKQRWRKRERSVHSPSVHSERYLFPDSRGHFFAPAPESLGSLWTGKARLKRRSLRGRRSKGRGEGEFEREAPIPRPRFALELPFSLPLRKPATQAKRNGKSVENKGRERAKRRVGEGGGRVYDRIAPLAYLFSRFFHCGACSQVNHRLIFGE